LEHLPPSHVDPTAQLSLEEHGREAFDGVEIARMAMATDATIRAIMVYVVRGY